MATAIEHLASSMKPMLLTIKKLANYGVDSIADVSIPKIVIVGDQSTGKSSLVEALAEIQVPRGSGTCTRCPLEISVLNHPGPWTAEVKLLRKWEPASHDARTVNDRDFDGWTESQTSILPIHFATVTNKEDLEHAIRLAQLANLNPMENPKHFAGLSADVAQKLSLQTQLQFSPNAVTIEIKGEDLPNLSFVDLPGIISQSDAGYHLVTLVRNLAKHHMKQKNTLVLLVISMENDVMNSAASGLVSEVGAHSRSVGVLTKPDRRDDSVTQWQEVLLGQKFRLDLGYHVVKQPATHMLNKMSYDQARAEETAFFNSPEWQSQFPHSTDRQGTRNLQCTLSQHLVAIARSSIPEIEVKIAEKLKVIDQQLAFLPAPTKAPRYEIEKIVVEFGRVVAKIFSCSYDGGKLSEIRSIWKKEVENFKHEILEQLQPKLLCKADLDEPTRKRKRAQGETVVLRPSPSAIVKNEIEVIDLDDSTATGSDSSSVVESVGLRPSKNCGLSFKPSQLREKLEYFRFPGMANRIHGNAINHLCLEGIQAWERPTVTMIEKMGKVVANFLVKLAKHNNLAGKWPGCLLERKMVELITEFVQDRKARQIRLAQDAYEREKHLPVVLNTEAYEEDMAKEQAKLEEQRYVARAKVLAEDDISSCSNAGKREALEASMMDRIMMKDSPYRKKVGPEPYTKELEVMAEIRAFYSYSAYRYAELIMQLVETGLLSKFNELKIRMQDEFRYEDEESEECCAMLLEQEPARMEKRRRLVQQQQVLKASIAELHSLRQVSNPDGMDLA